MRYAIIVAFFGVFLICSAALAEEKFLLDGKSKEEVSSGQRDSGAAAKSGFEDFMKLTSEKYGVPLGLMVAIAQTESRFNPWALNIAGKSYSPKSKKEALGVLEKNTQESFDVGLMQINSFWLRRFKLSVSDAIEPHINILLAAYILNENLIAHGARVEAVMAYHSPNPTRGRRYAEDVWRYYRSYLATAQQTTAPQ